MADVPRPGMPQSEKDRLGAELRAQAEREARLAGGETVPDEQLDQLTKDELLAEADLRGVQVKSGATKPEIVAALRGEQEEEG
jgi:hypothetical protein